MAESKQGKRNAPSAPEESAVRRAVSGTRKTVVSTCQAISGSFRALIGKSSGSIRAVGREAQVIYSLAPGMIRRAHRGLTDDEVDDVVALLIEKELTADPQQWSFVRHPELRERRIVLAIRRYAKMKERGWRKRARADGVYLGDHEELLLAVDPATKLQNEEAQAVFDSVMQRMSATRRTIYTAIRLEGWSHKELAAATGWSLQFIKQHMTRANQMVADAARAFLEGRHPVVPKRGRPRKIVGGTPA